MSVFAQIFSDELKLNLTDDNSFVTKFSDYSSWIIGKGQILHIPNMDVNPVVTTGLIGDGAFSSTASVETSQTLTLERYQIAPYRIPLSDELYTAYDKMKGLATQISNKITDYVHTDLLIKTAQQCDATRFVPTTGSAGVANGAFGQAVKMVKIEDIFTLAKKMDQDKVKKDGRYIVMNPSMYYELMASADNINYNRMDFLGTNPLESGVINRIAGINIMVRAEIPYGATGAISNQGVAPIAGDKFACVAFQSDEVIYALGTLNILEDTGNVFKFADLISAETYMFAGSPRIATKRVGLYVLQQA